MTTNDPTACATCGHQQDSHLLGCMVMVIMPEDSPGTDDFARCSCTAYVAPTPTPVIPFDPSDPERWTTPDTVDVAAHDAKGLSEEKCLRCGWVMGREPLNCNNDNTPHRFPSQVAALDAERVKREAAEADARWWKGKNKIAEAEVERLRLDRDQWRSEASEQTRLRGEVERLRNEAKLWDTLTHDLAVERNEARAALAKATEEREEAVDYAARIMSRMVVGEAAVALREALDGTE